MINKLAIQPQIKHNLATKTCYKLKKWNTPKLSQMQEMHKGNYTYATTELPHTQLKKSNTHQAPPANEW
jgi:hypothetical protein